MGRSKFQSFQKEKVCEPSTNQITERLGKALQYAAMFKDKYKYPLTNDQVQQLINTDITQDMLDSLNQSKV